MFRLPHNKRLARNMPLLGALTLGVLMLAILLKPGETVIAWTGLLTLLILGGTLFVIPLGLPNQRLVNRWYCAAYWTGWILSPLLGILCICAAVIWGIAGLPLGPVAAVTGVMLTAAVLGVVGGLLFLGLGVTGFIAQGKQETRQQSRSLGRTTGEAGARAAPENIPPA